MNSKRKDIETLESEVEALRTMTEAMETGATIIEAEFDRMMRKSAHNLLRIVVHRLRFQQCRSHFRAWSTNLAHGQQKDLQADVEQQNKKEVQALQTQIEEMKTEIANVKTQTDVEIMKVMKKASDAQEAQRHAYADEQERVVEKRASSPVKAKNDSSDTDDDDVVAPPTVANIVQLPPLNANASPADFQLHELQAMVNNLMDVKFE